MAIETNFILPEPFDVEEVKELIRSQAGKEREPTYSFQKNHTRYYAIGLIVVSIEKFGTDFLREVLGLGYPIGQDWPKSPLACFLDNSLGVPDETFIETVRLLREAGSDYKGLAMNSTLVRDRSVESIQFLLENGWKLGKNKDWLRQARTPEMATLLLSHGAQPQHRFIRTYRPEVILECIEAGFDINSYDELGRTPLFHAIIGCVCCVTDKRESIRRLIALGADPSLVSSKIAEKTAKELFIETYGEEEWIKDFGFEPFMWTSPSGTKWRISHEVPGRLEASSLGLEGLVTQSAPYKVLKSNFDGKCKLVCLFYLEGELVEHEV